MTDKDELIAEAEALGVKVHGNAKPETIRRKIEAAKTDPLDDPGEVSVDVDDGWPQRIAPCAWLDQKGRRYTDLGEAIAGAQECRDST